MNTLKSSPWILRGGDKDKIVLYPFRESGDNNHNKAERNHIMTPQEKLDQRIAAWISVDDRSFDTEETAAAYQRRTRRFLDVINLKVPDRVPNLFMASGYMMTYFLQRREGPARPDEVSWGFSA